MLFAALILIAVVAAILYFSTKGNGSFRTRTGESPLEIIEKMYARGDIDRGEFERRRSVLTEGHDVPRKEEVE